ncbi:hypothetical protein KQI41_06695 [Tissierella pigra]|uniref:hypothetical protein n=1 Tax=Tissierella pigra TaxID=2607614 RepID=UPI001C110058|nr:hypothetical protein [Tissierella pigra]MBU5426100.1 hypothetical protein [Tissierella pigra]
MNKKKILISISIVFIIMISIIIYMRSQSIYAKSENGEWKAYYRREFLDPKATWSGYLYYTGQDTDIEVATTFIVNGNKYADNSHFSSRDVNYTPSFLEKLAFGGNPKKVFTFAVFGTEKKASEDCELIIKYKVDGDIYEEKLVFK